MEPQPQTGIAPQAPQRRGILDGLDESAERFARASKSPNTARSYDRAWRSFAEWCRSRGEVAMPASPSCVANYVAARAEAGRKTATIQVDVAAIRQAHLLAGERTPTDDPQVAAVMGGVRRVVGARPDAKDAAMPDQIAAFVAALGSGLAGDRDRAMILLGFAGAFRRSEIVALRVEDVAFERGDSAVVVSIRRSKTDQTGLGLDTVVHATRGPNCPVAALRAWMAASGVQSGPLFRPVRNGAVSSERSLRPAAVAEAVKRAAAAAGMDSSRYAGHSLRAGFVTAATAAGVPLQDIMGVTHHRKADTALGYVRRGAKDSPDISSKLGL